MLALRSPAGDRDFHPPTELGVGFNYREPSLAFAAHLELEQLPQVMAESRNKGGVLPTRTVSGALEAIDTAIWPTLHNNVALEFLQSLQRHL
jgi:hypothetical protein